MVKIVFLKHCPACEQWINIWMYEKEEEDDMCVPCKYGTTNNKGRFFAARFNFIKKIESIGGKVIGTYRGKDKNVECLCRMNHICFPCPNYIRTGKGICKICARQSPDESYKKFVEKITFMGGQVIGKYVNAYSPIECICEKGHICFPSSMNVNTGLGMCKQCIKSKGEFMLEKTLKSLNVEFNYQSIIESIPKLRFDYSFISKGQTYYVEYDDKQHFMYVELYHKSFTGFNDHKQRDILKTHICAQQGHRIIRIDYTWKNKPLESWIDFLKSAIVSEETMIFSSPDLYTWLFQLPGMKCLDKYYVRH